jgi:O-antigen chain-terminating methyltransferase
MDTKSNDYKAHLEKKYLPGRKFYLHYIVYPLYIKEFSEGEIWDFGCGLGEFLRYCRVKNRKAFGVDSNPNFVDICLSHGLNVQIDDIANPRTIHHKLKNVICDNVLEHLRLDSIRKFFVNMKRMMLPAGTLLVIVPGEKGFLKDPTHKTFIDKLLMRNLCEEYNVRIDKLYYYPINKEIIGKYFYLNMSVYRLIF